MLHREELAGGVQYFGHWPDPQVPRAGGGRYNRWYVPASNTRKIAIRFYAPLLAVSYRQMPWSRNR